MSGLEEAYEKGFDAGREAEAEERLVDVVGGEIEGAFNALDAYFPKHMKGAEIIAEAETWVARGKAPLEVVELLGLVRMYGIRRPGWDR